MIDVLLVEDNPGDVLLARETFAESKLALTLSVASDGVQALEMLEATQLPDLVLLDLNLPRKDGREVLAAMKASRRLRPIPVVILTSSDAERDVAQTYSLGASCYVTKPVALHQFEETVRAIGDFWFTVVRLPPRS